MLNKKYSALLAVIFFIGPVASSYSSIKNSFNKKTSITITTEQFGRACIQHDAPTVEALKSGEKWAVLIVTAYSPPENSHGFVVAILSGDKNTKHTIHNFTIHPQTAFNSKDGSEPHKFLLPVKHYPSLIGKEETCFQISFFLNEKNETKNGWADIEIKIVSPTI